MRPSERGAHCTSYPPAHRRHPPIHATNAHAMRNWGCTCEPSTLLLIIPTSRPCKDSFTILYHTHTHIGQVAGAHNAHLGCSPMLLLWGRLWASSILHSVAYSILHPPNTSLHQYWNSILLMKYAWDTGWEHCIVCGTFVNVNQWTTFNTCTRDLYIFDVIPSWFEVRVPPELDKTWKLSIWADIDMYTSSLLYFSCVWI